MPNNLSLKDAEAARNAVTAAQKSEISQLYTKWADEIAQKAKAFEGKTTMSAPLQAANLRQLEKELRANSKQLANEVAGKAKDSLYKTSEAVIKTNAAWLQSLGYPPDGIAAAFTSVQDQVVKRIVTGQVYGGGWSLSKAIWSDNEKMLKDIHTIVAGGIAQNKPVYEVAKELEQYVSPGKAKQWNKKLTFYSKEKKPGFTYNPNGDPKRGMWEQTGRIYKKTVDYNAQRLVRTLAQHSYQQTLEGVCKKNPFVLKFVWHANGSRACKMCLDLDGLVFEKGMLPLDHPNGMCTFEPMIDPDMVDKLADWVWADAGKYPEIDEFSKMLGFTPVKQMTAQEFMLKYGALEGAGSKAKSWTTWYNALPKDAQMAASTLKMSSGKGWQSWFADVIYSGDEAIAGSAKLKQLKNVEKIVQSDELSAKFLANQSSESKTWTTWFNKLSQEDQMIAKALKEKSGDGWATFYSKHVYTGDGTIGGAKGSSVAKKAAKVVKTEQKAVAKVEQSGLTHEQFVAKLTEKAGDLHIDDGWSYFSVTIKKEAGSDISAEFYQALNKLANDNSMIMNNAWKEYLAGNVKSKELDEILAKAFNIEKKAQKTTGAVESATSKAKTPVAKKAAKVAKTEQKVVAVEQNGLTHEQFIAKVSENIDGQLTSNWYAVYDKLKLEAGEAVSKDFFAAIEKLAAKNNKGMNQIWNEYLTGKTKSKELDQILAKAFNIEKKAETASSSAVDSVTSAAKKTAAKTEKKAENVVKAEKKVPSKMKPSTTATTSVDDATLKKEAQKALKNLPKDFQQGYYFSDLNPLYNNIGLKFGDDILASFKTVLHEVKVSGGFDNHLKAWKSYMSGSLDKKLASKIDKVLSDGSKAIDKIKAEEKAAKKKAIENAKKKAEEIKKKYGSKPSAPETGKWQQVLDKNTRQWMRENESANSSVWTASERSGIHRYTGHHYTRMNGELNGIAKTDFVDPAKIEKVLEAKVKSGDVSKDTLDCYRGLQKSIVTEPTVVRRGTGYGEIGELFGNYSSYGDAKRACSNMTVDELRSNFVGKTGINKQFESCSPVASGGFSGNAEFVFYLNPGCQGTCAIEVSSHGNELEFLLNSGHKMICREIEGGGGRGASVRVYIEVLPK